MITDFHTHAFPDALAERAIRTLASAVTEAKAHLDGKVSSLLASMDQAGIDRAVICSIATKPEQAGRILDWSKQIATERVIPFPSVHPRDPDALGAIDRIAAAGFKGIKLHPYYQDFDIDEERMLPLYERIDKLGLILVCHTGFDEAFPRIRRCDPRRIMKVAAAFPRLKLVTTHLGAWQDWDEVRAHMLGKPVYMDISMSLENMTRDTARALLLAHPSAYILFASDSPWSGQSETLARFRALNLGLDLEEAILGGNASRLLEG